MRRFLLAVIAGSMWLVSPGAEAQPAPWQSRCIDAFQHELAPLAERDRLFRGATLHYSPPGARPPFVIFGLVTGRQETFRASVQRGIDMPPREWERDDQWNYPIDPAIAWRERRTLPDVAGEVSLGQRAQGRGGASATQRGAFLAAAKRGVDACMLAVSTFRAPGVALEFSHVTDDGQVERIAVSPNGATSWSHRSTGGMAGEQGMLSASEIDPLIDLLVKENACALQGRRDVGTSLRVSSPKISCEVWLTEPEWRTQPHARRVMDAVLGLRETLHAHAREPSASGAGDAAPGSP